MKALSAPATVMLLHMKKIPMKWFTPTALAKALSFRDRHGMPNSIRASHFLEELQSHRMVEMSAGRYRPKQ